jgi:hypothetical protein
MNSQKLDASGTKSNADSEIHLVELAQAGDEAAFRALFEAHKRRVYSLCLRMTRSAAAAEDLTQEAFLLVFRKICVLHLALSPGGKPGSDAPPEEALSARVS